MLNLDDDELALAQVALILMRDACASTDDPMQRYVENKADTLIGRIAQYQKDKENGDV